MQKIHQLSPHVANLIAAGEVVERPASVVKELLENAVDAGATAVTVELRGGGMTFLRVTDNGCGMEKEDARTAFLRHATSKLRNADDLAAISTMGFRGEALAAIASVSRIELMTKTAGSISGTSLFLEGGTVVEETEAGCPDGTTIIVRDLFFNTPARMKFMKSDVVEGSRVTAAVQMQALAHPELSIRLLRDGKEVLSTPGTGKLRDAVYCVYGRDSGKMVSVDSKWEGFRLTGFVSLPTQSRPSRAMQAFFVNGRPVRSRQLVAALEEAYRNRIMVGKFPACVLQLEVPANAVDVNVHPAKTEVKFLNEKAAFDCVHYGVLGALNSASDRPQVRLDRQEKPASPAPAVPESKPVREPMAKQTDFFRTMTTQEYQAFSGALQNAPKPIPEKARSTFAAVERQNTVTFRENVMYPQVGVPQTEEPDLPPIRPITPPMPPAPSEPPVPPAPPVPKAPPEPVAPVEIPIPSVAEEEPEQQRMEPESAPQWRYVGELYRSYVIVEQGDEAYLIDKHAAHERILFDRLKSNQEAITGQLLLAPIPCRLEPNSCAALLDNREMLENLGFEIDTLGTNTVILRQIPMDLSPEDACQAVEELAAELLVGRREDGSTVRDELLHTVACKAAIKAGWHTDEKELLALIGQVMAREDLKYCPHGRPICITLSKKQLEKQFKRS